MNTKPIVDFNDLDLSVLDELAELQARRTLLVGRLTQMDERRGDVAPAVYLRVRADDEQQRKKLEGEEQPLKHNARSIYARVRDRIDALEREEGDARLNLQERNLTCVKPRLMPESTGAPLILAMPSKYASVFYQFLAAKRICPSPLKSN